MVLSAIVAIAENNVIGKDQDLIWHIPNDLKRFKNITNGHCIIMGRKTYESIGKALPNRTNIIITRQNNYLAKGCIIVSSLEAAIAKAKSENEDEAFIIGGAEIYRQSLPIIDKLYLTKVHESFDGDTFFPDINLTNWKLVYQENHSSDEKNLYDHSFMNYIKT